MDVAFNMAMAVLAALAIPTIVYFGVGVTRVWRALRSVPPARAGVAWAPPDEEAPSVCVIVPAHNEERVIEHVVSSILRQNYPKWRAVFALDRCTDRTKEIIREVSGGDSRIEIIEIDACPEDWAGKTNALRVGVRDSDGAAASELLLFVDADTDLHPDCIRATVGLMLKRELDLVSLLSTLSRERWYEKIVQPVAVLELMRQHPLHRVNRTHKPASFANGQFMLFRRASYEALGGHERVKEALLEDLAFARALKADGGRWGVFIAGQMLRCRMYGDWGAFRRGWKRIFIESSRRRPRKLRTFGMQIGLEYVVMPLATFAAVGAGLLGVFTMPSAVVWATLGIGVTGLILWFLVAATIYASQGASVLWTFASPIGAWLLGMVLWEAARDLEENRGLSWGGRVYTNLMDQPLPGAAPRA